MTLFDLDHWQEIADTLSHNRVRTLLTAFGVCWGIFLLIVMLGAGRGLRNGVSRGFADAATNSVFVWTQSTSKPYRGLPRGRHFDMTDDDVAALRSQVAEIEVLAPRLQLGGYRRGVAVTHGTRSGAFSVMGDVPEIRAIQAIRVAAGRFINPIDVAESRRVAVLGTRVREVLFGDVDPIGESIAVRGAYFKVVGTFEFSGDPEEADQQHETIYVPLSTFQHAFAEPGRIGWLALTSRPDVPASAMEERVLDLLKKRHQVAPDDARAFGHFNLQEQYRKVQGLFAGIEALIWIVGTGTLAAGAIGVSNIMLIVVRERTKEIGIRRAVGATPMSISTQIVLEAVLLTLAAGMAGIVGGVWLLELAERLLAANADPSVMFQHPGVDLGNVLQGLAALVVTGVLAGLLPAQRAIAVSAVDALRSEG